MEGHKRVTTEHYSKALELCGQFLSGNWSDPDRIDLEILTGGYANFVFKCELKEPFKDDESQPHRVILRFITKINPMRCLGESGEALAMKAVADAGIGPKLLGTFEGGRLEEFIDCRMFTKEETRNREVLMAIGRQLARQHSLQIEIRKDPNVYKNCIRGFVIEGSEIIRNGPAYKDLSKFEPKVRTQLEQMLKVDFVKEFDWIMDKLKQVRSRVITLSHGDHYLNNVLVRKSWTSGRPINEFDVISIDVEMGSYFYRGLDIGLFIHELAFNFAETSRPEFLPPISDDLERSFISAYLERWQELNPEKFDPSLDTYESVQLESRILCLYASTYFPCYLMKTMAKSVESVQFEMVEYMVRRRQIDLEKKNWITEQLGN